jgi:excisionase family DNA binding protein
MSNNEAKILTVSEVSEYLNIHRTTVYRLLRERRLPGFRIGSDWRFSVEAIERWLRDHTESGAIDSAGAAPTPTGAQAFANEEPASKSSRSQPLPLRGKRRSSRARRP